MVTYGGDEVNALVIDVGTSTTKAGYAGEDVPKAVFSSWVGALDVPESDKKNPQDGQDVEMTDNITKKPATLEKKKTEYFVGDGPSMFFRENMEMKNPLKEGLVTDWDVLEQIWDHAFHNRLRINPSEHPLLIAESSWNTKQIREKLAELAFEKYNFPAIFVCKNAVLSAFATGRSTACVVDCGAGMTSAVPVYDGYVLKKGILKQPIAGDSLTENALSTLEEVLKIKVTPRYQISKKLSSKMGKPSLSLLNSFQATPSFHRRAQLVVCEEYKESTLATSEIPFHPQILSKRPMKSFEFPDGYNNDFGVERYSVPEILFQPREFLRPTHDSILKNANKQLEYMGIHQLINSSIKRCDVDIQSSLLSNIVLTGGTSLLKGITDRLNNELAALAAGKVKIHAPANTVERKYSSWIGGSILASLGSFHQLWVSKKEVEDHGPAIIEKRCQ